MRWVTFDCFGTLVDWHTGFSSLLQPLAGSGTPDLLTRYHRFERLLESDKPYRRYRDVLIEGLVMAAGEISIPLTREQASVLPDRWGELPIFEDVEPMLAELVRGGLQLGVLTNCDVNLFQQTERNFVKPFDLVITAEEVRSYKPSPGHFQAFRDRAKPSAWVHVACSWFHDMVPAEQIGVARVWLDRDRTGEDPSRVSVRVTAGADVPDAIRRVI